MTTVLRCNAGKLADLVGNRARVSVIGTVDADAVDVSQALLEHGVFALVTNPREVTVFGAHRVAEQFDADDIGD